MQHGNPILHPSDVYGSMSLTGEPPRQANTPAVDPNFMPQMPPPDPLFNDFLNVFFNPSNGNVLPPAPQQLLEEPPASQQLLQAPQAAYQSHLPLPIYDLSPPIQASTLPVPHQSVEPLKRCEAYKGLDDTLKAQLVKIENNFTSHAALLQACKNERFYRIYKSGFAGIQALSFEEFTGRLSLILSVICGYYPQWNDALKKLQHSSFALTMPTKKRATPDCFNVWKTKPFFANILAQLAGESPEPIMTDQDILTTAPENINLKERYAALLSNPVLVNRPTISDEEVQQLYQNYLNLRNPKSKNYFNLYDFRIRMHIFMLKMMSPNPITWRQAIEVVCGQGVSEYNIIKPQAMRHLMKLWVGISNTTQGNSNGPDKIRDLLQALIDLRLR